jgi:DNA-binding LytR/AlgR family response regulator
MGPPAFRRHARKVDVLAQPGLGKELAGRRVLVVEDELLAALEVEAALEAEGCAIVGPVPTVGRALSLLDGPDAPSLDAALLDVNLRGEMVTPVARLLADRGLPFVLVTGYDGLDLREPVLGRAPRVHKPFEPPELVRTLATALSAATAATQAAGAASDASPSDASAAAPDAAPIMSPAHSNA